MSSQCAGSRFRTPRLMEVVVSGGNALRASEGRRYSSAGTSNADTIGRASNRSGWLHTYKPVVCCDGSAFL